MRLNLLHLENIYIPYVIYEIGLNSKDEKIKIIEIFGRQKVAWIIFWIEK